MDNLIDLKTQAKLVGFFRRLDLLYKKSVKYQWALMNNPHEWEYLQALKKHVLLNAAGEQLELEENEQV